MTPRRVSLLVGLLCLIASMSLAAAPPTPKPVDGKISGVEVCPQELCTNGAIFAGAFTGKVNGEHTTGYFLVQVLHETPLNTAPGLVTGVLPGRGFWIIRTKLGDFVGTIIGGMLIAKNNDRFDVNLMLQMTQPANNTLTFGGVLDHSGLDNEPIPEPPTITGDIS